ncbi:exodeoxyribonuclease VII large subunit [Pleionea litopenaei]|uniref:Exodeoxyribonuclease 7 large subunit n=1 Tax=Pleionea litopenaei TaxID=3070815 RepID=A0AA51X7Z8_9GAMM|nr:exodeoxyribonuclease VII large subunit [Pleionea sp. HL-JVS1]WMS88852.1 exodeoxyribonuclease VII large subunit [Pleionea sp. HL-JVS1]
MIKPVLQPRKPTERRYLSISELNRKVKGLLEAQGGSLLITGEISNFVAPASGHWYFTLKDQNAQVKCTMWRGRNQVLKFRPDNGMLVNARAKMTLYEARGDYQLNIDFLEPAGQGDLQAQFEQLKQKLDAAGLFAPERKKPIPRQPSKVGIITSPTGAAIRDVITVMQRRFPLTEIIIYPCQVQGKQAHTSIIQALELANQRAEVDVLLLTRGGGSLEDMWCFNHEQLAYAISQSRLPTVAAVGHEIDFSIAEFVADMRAPTPSAAAEILTQDQLQLRQTIDNLDFTLHRAVNNYLQQNSHRLEVCRLKLTDPEPLLKQFEEQMSELWQRAQSVVKETINDQRARLHDSQLKLLRYHPENQVARAEQRGAALFKRLQFAAQTQLKQFNSTLAARADRLNTVSPLATLARGYSITLQEDALITSHSQVKLGDRLTTRVVDGQIESQVTAVNKFDSTD